ncbi:MAG: hypothetical protein H8E54_03240 [Candidatus Aminicenantes bacterium]|nr:hypothetical protein [Candidatus Aminicenantes bacterium]
MEGIMGVICQICEFWDERMVCPSEDLRNLYKKKMDEGEDFNFPEGNGLKRFNEICSKCKVPLVINVKICPVCESTNIQIGIASVNLGYVQTYNYHCIECRRILYSHIKIL